MKTTKAYKHMPDYSKTKIYRIFRKNDPAAPCYVGATSQQHLSTRIAGHRRDYDAWKANSDAAFYCTSFKLLECGDHTYEILEKYPCANNNERRARERYWIDKLTTVNKNMPNNTKAQSQAAWVSKNPNYFKEWAEKNKEKQNAIMTCECGLTYKHGVRHKHVITLKHKRLIDAKAAQKPET